MKKQHVFIVIAVCFGLFLTWGALHVSASQDQPPTPVITPVPIILDKEQLSNPECLMLDPNMRASAQECRIRMDIENTEQQHLLESNSHSQDIGLQGKYIQVDSRSKNSIIWKDAGKIEGKGTNLQNPKSYSLSVYVENVNGQPAANLYVYAYTTNGQYMGYAQTGADGYAYLSISDGSYVITAASSLDHFFLYQKDVTVPGSITLTAVGTSEVTSSRKSGMELHSLALYILAHQTKTVTLEEVWGQWILMVKWYSMSYQAVMM